MRADVYVDGAATRLEGPLLFLKRTVEWYAADSSPPKVTFRPSRYRGRLPQVGEIRFPNSPEFEPDTLAKCERRRKYRRDGDLRASRTHARPRARRNPMPGSSNRRASKASVAVADRRDGR